MTAPTFVAWAARLGRLRLDGTLLSFLGLPVTAWVLLLPALVISVPTSCFASAGDATVVVAMSDG